jgi:hypothetical protein
VFLSLEPASFSIKTCTKDVSLVCPSRRKCTAEQHPSSLRAGTPDQSGSGSQNDGVWVSGPSVASC